MGRYVLHPILILILKRDSCEWFEWLTLFQGSQRVPMAMRELNLNNYHWCSLSFESSIYVVLNNNSSNSVNYYYFGNLFTIEV